MNDDRRVSTRNTSPQPTTERVREAVYNFGAISHNVSQAEAMEPASRSRTSRQQRSSTKQTIKVKDSTAFARKRSISSAANR